MKERRFKRYNTHLESIIIVDMKKYTGFVENVCEEGFAFVYMYDHILGIEKFSNDSIIRLLFSLPTKVILNMNCKIIWTGIDSTANKKLSVGLEIINPPKQFREFVKTLK